MLFSFSTNLVLYACVCLLVTLAVTGGLLWRVARPRLPLFAGLLTYLAWLCAFSVCFLVPIDLIPDTGTTLETLWAVLFWVSFFLVWILLPFASGYDHNGEFTAKQKIKASLRSNLMFLFLFGGFLVSGAVYLHLAAHLGWSQISSLALTLSNTWGLCCLIFTAGYGLAECPRFLWHQSQLQRRQRQLYYAATILSEETESIKDEIKHTSEFLHNFQLQIEQTRNETFQRYVREMQNKLIEAETKLDHNNEPPHSLCLCEKEALQVFETLKTAQPLSPHHFTELHMHVKRIVRRFALVEAQWKELCAAYKGLDCFPWAVQLFYRVAAVGAAFLSLLLVWMEMTLPFPIDLSPLGALLRTSFIRENPLALQLCSVIPLTYLSLCTYFPLFHLKGPSSLYCVLPGGTDEHTLFFNAACLLRVATPLAYNFVLLLKIDETALALRDFIGQMKVIPFWGSSFTLVFPFFIVVVFVFTLANGWSVLANVFHVQSFDSLYRKKEKNTQEELHELLKEGQKLIEKELQNTSLRV